MVTITGLIIGAAIFLLCWYFFVPGAKELFDEENNKRLKEEREWQERRLAMREKYAGVSDPPTLAEEHEQLQDANDWRIMKYYAYGTFVDGDLIYEQDKPVYTVSTDVINTAHALRNRLEKTCTWADHEKKVRRGLKTDNKDAILIQNIKTGVELYIGWHDGRIIIGSKLHEHTTKPLRIILVSDSI